MFRRISNLVRHLAVIARVSLLIGACSSVASAAPPPQAVTLREPVALALSRDGGRLYAACARSGMLVVVDPAAGRVLSENPVGRSLSDVAALPGSDRLFAVDRAKGALLGLEIRGDAVTQVDRVEVGPDPVSLIVSADGASCAVASLSARRLTILETAPKLRVRNTVDLPFSPRTLAWVRDETKIVVADAFGGKFAVVDPTKGIVVSLFTLPAHNIRGLATSPDGRTLAVAHQVLHGLGQTTFEDVHWGSLISNHVRLLRVDSLLEARKDGDVLRGSRLLDLGKTGQAAGDPSGVTYDRDGHLIVAVAGVDEVAIGADRSGEPQRVGVGRCPSALILEPGKQSAFVANRFDDSISLVHLGDGTVKTIALGPQPELTSADRGERLFHDAKLSHDGWMSCQSCHTDGHTNGLLSDTLGDGSFGAPKLVPSLLGVGATGPWTWTGSIERLEDQVRKSVETTMRGKPPTQRQVDDLTAFLRRLKPAGGASVEQPEVERGRAIFRARGCAECHVPNEYTADGRFDVGLADEVGNRKFNAPSLRGVGMRSRFLHDGRAMTLEDVFSQVRHPRDGAMSAAEVADLVAFLKTL